LWASWKVRPASPIANDSSSDELNLRDGEELGGLAAGMEPQMYAEAMSGPDAGKWHKACQEEYEMHMENRT
jgi:hypothetical protein